MSDDKNKKQSRGSQGGQSSGKSGSRRDSNAKGQIGENKQQQEQLRKAYELTPKPRPKNNK